MTAKPIDNRVFILPDPKEDMVGGMYIPEPSQDAPMRGTAAFVGEKCTQIVQGDRIVFSKLQGVLIDLDGVEHIILKETDIHGIIKP